MDQTQLIFKPLGIDTDYDHIVYIREDSPLNISQNFEVFDRVNVTYAGNSIIAAVNLVSSDILNLSEISLSKEAAKVLNIKGGESLEVFYLKPLDSLSHIRAKIYGNELTKPQIEAIVKDIALGNYSNVHLSAFIVACATGQMTIDEITHLTQAMIDCGRVLQWPSDMVVDKHCIGGLPGNRTTPIVVSIVAAYGLMMPKTSSRAITSPAGTADTMEVLTDVSLTAEQIQKVVTDEGACVVWGGTSDLSPADDILIKIEKALDIDSNAQLIASVLSKKVAAGSKFAVIDIPTGETAKVRTIEAAEMLKSQMEQVAQAIGLKLKVVITDGSQPIGKGIGPALEARDVLAVLRNEPDAPTDLRDRSLLLAGELLELSGQAQQGKGKEQAKQVLESGQAYQKLEAMCKAQGQFKVPQKAKYTHEVTSNLNGTVVKIDNRKIAKIAKLSGAPESLSSGVDFLVPIGTKVEKDQVIYVVHAETEGELQYALDYSKNQHNIITIQ